MSLGAATAPAPAAAGGMARDVVLEARHVSKSFGGFLAVRDFSIRIHQGGVHALIGPNGAGKTTVFNLLTGFLPPSSGTIAFQGADVTRMAPERLARRGLVRSFQISATFTHLSVTQNIRIALQRPHVSPWRFWGQGLSRRDMDHRVRDVLDIVDLGDYAQRRAGDLPYGRKRALELATTLAADPQVLLLDEPTQGLGFEDVDRVADLIARIGQDRTVLMVEHNMRMVSRIAQRITVLRAGSIIADGSYDTVSANPEVVEAYLGSGPRSRRH